MNDDKFTISLTKDEVDLLNEVLKAVMEQCFRGVNVSDFENSTRAKSTISLYNKIENLYKEGTPTP